MRKLNEIGKRNFKKFLLDLDEHAELANDLRIAQNILEPWVERFYKAYSVNGNEVKQLKTVLNLLSSKICDTQDNYWYEQLCENEKKLVGTEHSTSPYYGKGKIAWL